MIPTMKTVAFIPNGRRYLVLPDKVEAKSETIGEYTISERSDPTKKASEGTVVSIGDEVYRPDCNNSALGLERSGPACKYALGDKVVYGKYSGYEHTFDGVEYKVLAESEILGKRIITPFD